MTKLDDALQGVSRLGVDTAPVIYFMEANPQYDALVTEIFQRIANGNPEAYSPVITLVEVLVQPLRANDQQLVQDHKDLLLHANHFTTVALSPAIAASAADFRARYHSLRTPDALQIAAAMENGCQALLTNDTKLKQVTELSILILDELQL